MRERYLDHGLIEDIGSGINFKRKGLLRSAFEGRLRQVVVSHKDRLCRFGFDLVEFVLQEHGVEVVVHNEGRSDESPGADPGGHRFLSPEQEVVEDVLAIVHLFSCRINGRRKHGKKKTTTTAKSAGQEQQQQREEEEEEERGQGQESDNQEASSSSQPLPLPPQPQSQPQSENDGKDKRKNATKKRPRQQEQRVEENGKGKGRKKKPRKEETHENEEKEEPSESPLPPPSPPRDEGENKKGKRRKKPKANRCAKVRVYPTEKQKETLRRWFGTTRHIYNWVLSEMKLNDTRLEHDKLHYNFISLRNMSVTDPLVYMQKPWMKKTPKHVREGAVKDLVDAFTSNMEKKKKLNPNHHFELKFRTKKNSDRVSIVISYAYTKLERKRRKPKKSKKKKKKKGKRKMNNKKKNPHAKEK